MHPWEIDPGQPRVTGTTLKTRFRHYVNLARPNPVSRSCCKTSSGAASTTSFGCARRESGEYRDQTTATALVVRSSSMLMRRGGRSSCVACPDATFFHRFAWREIYESVFNHRTHYLLAERGDEIVGVLPLVELRSLLFGHSLCRCPLLCTAVWRPAIPTRQRPCRMLPVTWDASWASRTWRCATACVASPSGRAGTCYVTFRKAIAAGGRGESAGDPAQAARDGAQGHRARPAQRDRPAR